MNLLHIQEPALEGQPSSYREVVSLALIKGICNRRRMDFDANFRPRQRHNWNRWVSVATAVRRNRPLPPVELIKVDDAYFVVDGHHRLSVANSMGVTDIVANVTEWQRV